jgi:protein-S-isoprenylcysteine O-methyltransferase Ste14
VKAGSGIRPQEDPARDRLASTMFIVRVILHTLLLPGTFAVTIPSIIVSTGHSGLAMPGITWHALGLAPIVAGAGMVLWSIADFALRGKGTLAPIDPPKQLVVRGLYRYVRNPMYAGVTAILLGESLLFASSGLLWNALGFFISTHCFVVYYEEPNLLHRFGDSYAQYRRKVHRWLPVFPRG